jgi:PfaD family protein
MANGISSETMVVEMTKAGMLSFFGAAGLHPDRIANSLDYLQQKLAHKSFGVNLIHSPQEPRIEAQTVELFLARGMKTVEASAFIDLTLPLVRYRVSGVRRREDGLVVSDHRLMAKVSRVEVAERFLSPPPQKIMDTLMQAGQITQEQASLARQLPMADDLTAEADSGGHTDGRPAVTLLPSMIDLRNRLAEQFVYKIWPRVGAAGGLGTPSSLAAAFAMGSDYVVTGSINQACLESGTSDEVRQMLAECGQSDTAMAAAADMFEMGVSVQVIKRGTLFAMRANKLLDLYRRHNSLDDLAQADRNFLEVQIFRKSLSKVWQETSDYFAYRDPEQIVRAEKNPKHKMALCFRWYLGQSSSWANQGLSDRKIDYQIWAGPAMGAFNQWTKGSYLEDWQNRRVVDVANQLLRGAAYQERLRQLKIQGYWLTPELQEYKPRQGSVVA